MSNEATKTDARGLSPEMMQEQVGGETWGKHRRQNQDWGREENVRRVSKEA